MYDSDRCGLSIRCVLCANTTPCLDERHHLSICKVPVMIAIDEIKELTTLSQCLWEQRKWEDMGICMQAVMENVGVALPSMGKVCAWREGEGIKTPAGVLWRAVE